MQPWRFKMPKFKYLCFEDIEYHFLGQNEYIHYPNVKLLLNLSFVTSGCNSIEKLERNSDFLKNICSANEYTFSSNLYTDKQSCCYKDIENPHIVREVHIQFL